MSQYSNNGDDKYHKVFFLSCLSLTLGAGSKLPLQRYYVSCMLLEQKKIKGPLLKNT